MLKLLDADAIAATIPDGATIAAPGNASIMATDHLFEAIERRFLSQGHPANLTLVQPCFTALGPGTGVHRFAHPGMLKRFISSSFPRPGRNTTPALIGMMLDGGIEAYSLPMGAIYGLFREIGAGRPGFLTPVGLGTFVDPEQGGGKLNTRTTEDLVERVTLGGQELLFYRSFPIDVALLKGSTADEAGNLSMEREPTTLGMLSLATAARASGGQVYAQVEQIVQGGSLNPRSVLVPGVLMDGVAHAPDAPQSLAMRYDPRVTGAIRATVAPAAIPNGPERIILARAARFIRAGWVFNLGVGLQDSLPRLLLEAGCMDLATATTEHGAVGGLPCQRPAFGAHINPEAVIDAADMFNLYTGGCLDAAFVGFAEIGPTGLVNVSRFGGFIPGPGGFIDITHRTPHIFLCGNFAAGGTEVSIRDGALAIGKEGRTRKLLGGVEQVTLNGPAALDRGQTVTLITERGLFGLTRDGWVLREIAPGIDPDRDLRPMMDFPLKISDRLASYPAEIMQGSGMAFNRWLRRSMTQPPPTDTASQR